MLEGVLRVNISIIRIGEAINRARAIVVLAAKHGLVRIGASISS